MRVRINLVGDSRTKKRWTKGRKRRGRGGSRTFEKAISMPQPVRRGSGAKKRVKETVGKARKKTDRNQAQRTRTARTRAERRQRARRAAAASSAGILQRIRWSSVGWRLLALVVLAALLGAMAYVSSDFSFFVYRDRTRIEGARFLQADEIFAVSGVN